AGRVRRWSGDQKKSPSLQPFVLGRVRELLAMPLPPTLDLIIPVRGIIKAGVLKAPGGRETSGLSLFGRLIARPCPICMPEDMGKLMCNDGSKCFSSRNEFEEGRQESQHSLTVSDLATTPGFLRPGIGVHPRAEVDPARVVFEVTANDFLSL